MRYCESIVWESIGCQQTWIDCGTIYICINASFLTRAKEKRTKIILCKLEPLVKIENNVEKDVCRGFHGAPGGGNLLDDQQEEEWQSQGDYGDNHDQWVACFLLLLPCCLDVWFLKMHVVELECADMRHEGEEEKNVIEQDGDDATGKAENQDNCTSVTTEDTEIFVCYTTRRRTSHRTGRSRSRRHWTEEDIHPTWYCLSKA